MFASLTSCTVDSDTLPVSIAEAGRQCRLSTAEVANSDISAELTDAIRSAQAYLEGEYDLSITSRTFVSLFEGRGNGDKRLYLKPFVSAVSGATISGVAFSGYELRKGASVNYLDCDRYFTNADRVEVTFVAGFSEASAIPANIKRALLLLTSNYFDNRNPEITGTIVSKFSYNTIDALMRCYKSIPVA